jgi:hypothetical protein
MESRETQQSRLPDRDRSDLANESRRGRRWLDAARVQIRKQRVNEERRSGCGASASSGKRSVRPAVQHRGYELCHPRLAERLQLDASEPWLGEEMRQPRVGSGRLVRAGAREHEHAQPLDPSHQIGREPKRSGVGPMDVVDPDNERRGIRQVRDKLEQAVHHRLTARSGVASLTAREHRGAQRGGAGQHALALTRCGRRDQPLEQLPHDPERQLLLQLAAAGREDRGATGARALQRHRQQRRLPDPSGTGDQDRLPLAALRPSGRPVEIGKLRLALEQRHHRPIISQNQKRSCEI